MKKILGLLVVVVVLGGIVYWVMQRDQYSTTVLTTADFAISDTAAVGKVVITSTEGDKVTIARGKEGIWMVNDKYRARVDGIDLILKTLHLLEIKHPTPERGREEILRMMAGRHKYVQVFDREGAAMKSYYVGMSTMDEQGTYMLLELPGKGRTEIPYVMTMKSYFGYLYSRFFIDEVDWRDRILFRYNDLDFNRVEVLNHLHPDRSFAIEYKGGNDLSLYEMPENTPIPSFDTARIKEYLLLYKKAGCETYDLAFTQAQKDSVLALDPHFEIKVTANDPNESKQLNLYLRPAPDDQMGEDVHGPGFDNAIMYATLDGKELMRVQRFVFNAFLTPKQAFTHELDF